MVPIPYQEQATAHHSSAAVCRIPFERKGAAAYDVVCRASQRRRDNFDQFGINRQLKLICIIRVLHRAAGKKIVRQSSESKD